MTYEELRRKVEKVMEESDDDNFYDKMVESGTIKLIKRFKLKPLIDVSREVN